MGIEIVEITDYDVILDLLIQQYKDKPKFKGILESMNLQANDFEEAIFEIRDNFWIDSAEGIQLDVLGEIQGELRQGKNDADYKEAIQAKIIVNNGSGEFETIIIALTRLMGFDTVQMYNMGSAKLSIWIDGVLTEDQYNQLIPILASGIGLFVVMGSSNPFVFFGDSDGSGFNKVGGSDGGEFQGVWQE